MESLEKNKVKSMLFLSKDAPKQYKERSFGRDQSQIKAPIYKIQTNAKINSSFLETPRSLSRKES